MIFSVLNPVKNLTPIACTFVQHFTRFQLTVCTHGSSGLAELLVNSSVNNGHNISTDVARRAVPLQ